MKILLTSDLNGGNPIIDSLYHRLNQYIDVQASVKSFWSINKSIIPDIIHIQWPEQLFDWKEVDEKDLKKLINQLKLWKNNGCKIIVTRHNILPHKLNVLYKEVYEAIYSYSEAVIHYSNASIDNFNTMYNSKEIYPIHKLIFHPMYSNIKNDSNKKSARDYLGICENKKVILIFGEIRHEKERQFALNVFNKLELDNKLLLVPRWYNRIGRRTPIKWLFSNIRILLDYFNKELKLSQQFIPEEEIQMYMNASDVIFIPRFEVLNSGVLVLGYSFNKIVVGPSTGSIGEILNFSNNPSFEIGNVTDATLKIEEGLNLSNKKINNYDFAKKNMDWDIIIEQHIELYKEIISE